MSTTPLAREGLNAIDAARPLVRTPSLNTAGGANRVAQAFDLNSATSAPPASFGPSTPASFKAAMEAIASAKPKAGAAPESPEDARLRATAETLVNQLFMGTMLKQMRSSPFKDPTMSGGKAGDAYAGLFDQHLAGKAGGGMGKGLVDVMVNRLKGNRGQAPASAATNVHAEYLRNRRETRPTNKEHDDAATVNRAA